MRINIEIDGGDVLDALKVYPRVCGGTWAGTCLHVDHPFWRGRLPPNGWGCNCRVRQVTEAERDRLVAAGEARGKAPAGWRETRDVEVVRGTGEIVAVPTLKGVDAGWDHNPGRGRMAALGPASIDSLEAALRDMAALGAPNDLPGRWARRHLRGLARTKEARAAIRGRGEPGVRLPVGVLSPAASEALGSGRLLTLRSSRKRHGGEPLKPDAPAVVQAVLDAGRSGTRRTGHAAGAGTRRWTAAGGGSSRRWTSRAALSWSPCTGRDDARAGGPPASASLFRPM